MKARFEVRRELPEAAPIALPPRWYWALCDRAGRDVAQSRMYRSRGLAVRSLADALRVWIPEASAHPSKVKP